jgi:Flp pilus assembly protein TadG
MMMPRKPDRRKGNAMIEFAISAAVLLPCFVGIFEFGYSFYLYNRLTGGVRAGARYASLARYDSASATPSNAYRDAVRNVVVYGSPEGGSTALVPGLAASQVSVSMQFANSVPDMVTVSISSFSVDTVFTTLTWNNKPSASFRYEGTWAPNGGN